MVKDNIKTEKILVAESGRKFFYKGQDLHTQYGYVKDTEIKKAKDGDLLTTNKNIPLFLMSPTFLDYYSKISRLAQVIPLKDIGSIIAMTGLNKTSKVLDAGSGSGGLACFLANFVKKMYTCDIRDDHIEVVKKNKDFLGLSNLQILKKNIYENETINVRDIDTMILDVPEPWKALNSAIDILNVGGYLVSYSPHIPQTVDFVNTLKDMKNFLYINTIEVIHREWEIDGRKVRPKTSRMGHSGFITVVRKIC